MTRRKTSTKIRDGMRVLFTIFTVFLTIIPCFKRRAERNNAASKLRPIFTGTIRERIQANLVKLSHSFVHCVIKIKKFPRSKKGPLIIINRKIFSSKQLGNYSPSVCSASRGKRKRVRNIFHEKQAHKFTRGRRWKSIVSSNDNNARTGIQPTKQRLDTSGR